jgi:hypothetical protein
MSDRSLRTLRLCACTLLATVLAAPALAQTQPAPKAAPKNAAPAAESTDPDVALAKKAALDWLALVDAFKFDATWDEAATSFQKAQNKADWVKGLGGARPTMGKLVGRTFLNHEIRTNLPNLPAGKYITIRFTSGFEKHKNGSESVTLVKDGTRGYRMMSYLLK